MTGLAFHDSGMTETNSTLLRDLSAEKRRETLGERAARVQQSLRMTAETCIACSANEHKHFGGVRGHDGIVPCAS